MKKTVLSLLGVIALGILLCGFSCNSQSEAKKLATASDAIAHGVANAQAAANQAVSLGVMSAADFNSLNAQLVNVAQAGLALDAAIRANESAPNVQTQVNNFLNAFNTLQQQGVVGIKDPNTKVAISTIVTGLETSISVITATIGGK